MKKIYTLIFIFASFVTYSQIGVGTTTPDANAQLDVVSTTRGILIPRLDQTQANTLAAIPPQTGMLIFNTTQNCFQYFDGTAFTCLATVSATEHEWNDSTGYIIAADALANGDTVVVTDDGKIGVGTLMPGESLDVNGKMILRVPDSAQLVSDYNNVLMIDPETGLVKTNQTNGAMFLTTPDGRFSFGDTTGLSGVASNTFARFIRPAGTANIRLQSNDGQSVFYGQAFGTGNGSILRLTKGNGTKAAPLIVEPGDGLGQIGFWGYTNRTPSNEGMTQGATFGAEVDSGAVADGDKKLATRFVWRASDGVSSPYKQMTLTSKGKLGIGSYLDPQKQLHVNAKNDSLIFENLAGSGTLLGIDADGKVFKSDGEGTHEWKDTSFIVPVPGLPGVNIPVDGIFARRAGNNDNIVFVSESGNVGIGGIPLTKFQVTTDNTQDDVSFARFLSSPANDDLDLDIIRGYGTPSSPTVVTDANARIGGLRYRAYINGGFTGSALQSFAPVAEISAEMDGAPSTTSAPGKLLFRTTSIGSINTSTRMVIKNDGNVGIGTPNPVARLDVGGTGSMKVPVGTTAERPATPAFGMIRYNSTIGRGEMYVNDVNGDGTQGDAGWRAL